MYPIYRKNARNSVTREKECPKWHAIHTFIWCEFTVSGDVVGFLLCRRINPIQTFIFCPLQKAPMALSYVNKWMNVICEYDK